MRVFKIKQNNIDASYRALQKVYEGSDYSNQHFSLNSANQTIFTHYYNEYPGIEISVNHFLFDEDTLFIDESDDANMVVFQFVLKSHLKFKVGGSNEEKVGTIQGASMYNTKYSFELMVPRKSDVKFITIRLKLDMLHAFKHSDWAQFDELLFKPIPWMLYETLDLEMEALVKDLFSVQEKEAGRKGYTIGKSIVLITAFMKQLANRRNDKHAIGHITIAPEILLQIKEEIVNDFEHPVSVETLAQNHGMSAQKLRVNFKNFFGKSVNQLWQQLRYEEAERRLRYSEEPILNIALALGFKEATHFANGFKERRGISPSEYRNK